MEEEGVLSPILQHEKTTFAYIKYSNLYLVAMTRTNANTTLIFVYLYRMIQVILFILLSLLNYAIQPYSEKQGILINLFQFPLKSLMGFSTFENLLADSPRIRKEEKPGHVIKHEF